jgi:hypothetical protein
MGYFTVDGQMIPKFIKYEVEDGIECHTNESD